MYNIFKLKDMKRFFLFLMPLILLASCKDGEDITPNNYFVDIATVENPEAGTHFYFTLDDKTRMLTATSTIKYYRPKDGQRIVANYTILNDKAASSGYDHDVRLNDVYEVLTKGIFNITSATKDSIGNEYIHIEDMWIGSDYLNVEFDYPGGNKIHYINLVSDSSKTYTDGKIHLEFRHNSNGDYPYANMWGIASFNLKSLQKAGKNSTDIVVHTKEYYSNTTDIYTFTYNYGTSSTRSLTHKSAIPIKRALTR
jgi:hypothetical protein